MNPEEVEKLLQAGLPQAQIQVRSEDWTHFTALIVSDAFVGKRTIQRHQLVYAALGELMGREIHALSMQTLTVAEWQTTAQASQ